MELSSFPFHGLAHNYIREFYTKQLLFPIHEEAFPQKTERKATRDCLLHLELNEKNNNSVRDIAKNLPSMARIAISSEQHQKGFPSFSLYDNVANNLDQIKVNPNSMDSASAML